VTDARAFRPVSVALAVLKEIMNLHPREFRWAVPPYEYDFERKPIDLIMGRVGFAETLEECGDVREIIEPWEHGIEGFHTLREPFLMY
jgi:uncharacterized protein YbbC (DUF1343 family)